MVERFCLVSATLLIALALDGCTSPSSEPRAPTVTPTAVSGTSASTPPSAVDHGPEIGAEGSVIDDSTGDPVMYVVASGDNLSSIADRLGITVDELTTTSGAYAGIVPGQRLALRP